MAKLELIFLTSLSALVVLACAFLIRRWWLRGQPIKITWSTDASPSVTSRPNRRRLNSLRAMWRR
jgi:hypothetical protein